MIEGFAPLIGAEPKYLILGSAPSVVSLKQQEYYGNKQNSFWTVVSKIFAVPQFDDYISKENFILNHNIILWDVVKTCTRKGSLDSDIKDVIANEISEMLNRYPSIKHVMFNGQKAEKLYKKHISYYPDNISFTTLPSSSPAYTLKVEQKIKIWNFYFN